MPIPDGDIKEKLETAPEKPGVYIFKDKRERILYVGKARNLKKRLKSYFHRHANLDPRKTAMLRQGRDFSFTVTASELEALALEANLIKQHRPRFNVILKDDKNYPYLKLTLNEKWPRLEVVRRIKRDGSFYFGPFIPASSMWELLSFIRRHFHIRPCRYKLDRPMRLCVQHQMGRCTGPCADLVSPEEYEDAVKEVERFLKGEKKELIEELEKRMARCSEELRYEEAAQIRDRIEALKRAFESQKVVSPELGDIDVIGCYQEGTETVFQIFFIRSGILISTKDFFLPNTGLIPKEELFEIFVEFFYAKEIIPPEEVIIQTKPSGVSELRAWLTKKKGSPVKIRLPDTDKKKDLIAMSTENAKEILQSRKGLVPKDYAALVRERLALKSLPDAIGAFDVSTIFGSHSVGAFIWWEGGEFRKEFYRHLKIKEVKGIDDYAMMREIIFRTLKNLGNNLPDLLIIDGGKAHLDTAMQAISAVLGERGQGIDVIGIAKKPDRAILKAGKAIPISDSAPDAILLRRIRDEAHRFAISFHRKLRGKGLLESRLEKIRGVGKKRRLALLKRFGSIAAIKRSSPEVIARVDGMNSKLAEKLLAEL
jgi:excinuclease ABC subunit C